MGSEGGIKNVFISLQLNTSSVIDKCSLLYVIIVDDYQCYSCGTTTNSTLLSSILSVQKHYFKFGLHAIVVMLSFHKIRRTGR